MSPADSRPEYYQFEEINNAALLLFREARKREQAPGSVLDLGCGRARLGFEIERLGYTVTGIDKSSLACATARTRISEVIEGDFMDLEGTAAALNSRQFDWLVAADVLEHLVEPGSALRFYRRFLKRDGRLIVSLPNVAVWDNRLRLLLGRFDYRESGLPDRTHLRACFRSGIRAATHDVGARDRARVPAHPEAFSVPQRRAGCDTRISDLPLLFALRLAGRTPRMRR